MAHILVIDDEDGVRTPLRTLFEMAGHVVSEAADGRSGMEVQHQNPADLVITDLRMPGKDGAQIVREIRKDHPATKIIAISAFDNGQTEQLDVDWAVAKPFNLTEVLEKATELLSG